MENNISRSVKKPPNIFFWGVCFILILSIIVLPPTFQPYEWSKTILFRISLTILISFLLFRYFYKNNLSLSLPKSRIADFLPILLLLGFVLVVIISTVFSQDPRFSFFGNPARAGGSLNLLFYFAFSLFLALFIKNQQWEKLWKTIFIAAFLTSLLAVIQSFNLLKNIFLSYEGGGVPSFLGNSTFLAIYMLFTAIWAFVLSLQNKEKKQKFIYAGLFCLFTLTIFLSGSRATYLALLASFSFFFFFFPFDIKRIKTLKVIAGLLLLFAIIIVLIFNFFPQLGEKNYVFNRLNNRLSIKKAAEDLFGTRFAVWKIALQTIKEKPLLGWGPENFYIGFEKYYEPTAPNLQKLWWDRPHNIFLDIAASSGLIAVFLYALFWIAIFWKLQNFKREATGNCQKIYFAHGLQAMFLGYLITLFFNFDSFVTYLISFFFIGYSFYLIYSEKEAVKIENGQKIINYKNRKVWVMIFGIPLLIFLFFYNIKPLYLGESVNYAKNLAGIKKCDKAMTIMDSVNKNPGILKAYDALVYSTVIKKCANQQQEDQYAQKGFDALKKASAVQPKYTRTWLYMGSFTNVLAAREQNNDNKNKLLSETMDYLRQALKLSPKRQEILEEMEKNYLIAKDYKAMEETAYRCIDIDPTQAMCHWYLGVAKVFMGNQIDGKKHVQESFKIGGFPAPYIQLGAAYLSQNNYKDAFDVYHLLTASYPENANYHAVMAVLAKKLGNLKRAENEALWVFKLQPENRETIIFLEQLLEMNHYDFDLFATLAVFYESTGEKEKSRQIFLTAKNLYLKTGSRHFELMKIYRELGEYENALKEAEIEVKLNPDLYGKVIEYIRGYIPNGEKWAIKMEEQKQLKEKLKKQ